MRETITKTQIIPMLREACPSFQSEEELLSIALGDFARHLLDLYQNHQTQSFPAVAQVIERLHDEGDAAVKEAATIGLLEGIQNVWGNHHVSPELFAAHLLPESRRWWEELKAFWRGEIRYVGENIEPQRGSP